MAVDDGERAEQLADDVQALAEGRWGTAAEPLGKGFAGAVFEHQVEPVVLLHRVPQGDDVRVGGHAGMQAPLAADAGADLGVVGQFRADGLDRSLPAFAQIVGQVDGAHATLAQGAEDAVATADQTGLIDNGGRCRVD